MRSPSGTPPTAHATTVRHAMVVAGGETGERRALDAAWPGWDVAADLVVAADNGYRHAVGLGLAPDLLVGDLDSLEPETRRRAEAAGVAIRRADPHKDESDTELAVLEAQRMGAARITILGALGGPRLDHALANIWLLAHPALTDTEVMLLDPATRLFAVSAPDAAGRPVTRGLDGPPGATITLLPLGGDVTGIVTAGLRYPLHDEPLHVGPARGLSNVRVTPAASVTVGGGRLLIVEQAVTDRGLSSGRREVADE